MKKYDCKSVCKDICELVREKVMDNNEALWFLSYEGFLHLKDTKKIRAINMISYFLEKLLKKETPDGNITDEQFQEMAKELRKLYKEAGFETIPKASKIEKDLREIDKKKRDTLIELVSVIAFTFKPSLDDFQNFLQNKAFVRKLSPAVPQELMLMYCIVKGESRQKYNELMEYAQQNHLLLPDEEPYNGITDLDLCGENTRSEVYTDNNIEKELKDCDDENFRNTYLKDCCKQAYLKCTDTSQYSATAWFKVVKPLSILGEIERIEEEGQGNYDLYSSATRLEQEYYVPIKEVRNFEHHESIFLYSTLKKYAESFPLCPYGFSRVYDFPEKSHELIMFGIDKLLSVDEYGRFFSYRIRNQDTRRGLYSMKCGALPEEISGNTFDYNAIYELKDTRSHMGFRNRINRYTILNVIFSHFLLEHWKDKPIFETDCSKVEQLFKKFTNDAKELLENTGYTGFSLNNPYDALLKISMHSPCPLEVYTRIYELNVISSFINDPSPNESSYPPKERIMNVLEALISAYKKLPEKLLDAKLKRDRVESLDKTTQKIKDK